MESMESAAAYRNKKATALLQIYNCSHYHLLLTHYLIIIQLYFMYTPIVLIPSPQPPADPASPTTPPLDSSDRQLQPANRRRYERWTAAEDYTYITYLLNFGQIFVTETARRYIRLFQHMSQLITSRNPHQIKSHHQKMMIKYQSIQNVVGQIRLKTQAQLLRNPSFVHDIEHINRQAQTFFVNECAGSTIRSFLRHEALYRIGAECAAEQARVKIEEPTPTIVDQPVKQQMCEGVSVGCIKQQQEDMVARLSP